MTKILDVITIGKTRAVVGRINDDGTYAVVYSSGTNDVYEDAKLVDDKWLFLNEDTGAAYAKSIPDLQEAIRVLHSLS